MGGKDGRFKHDKSTTHEIGPGAYDTDNLPSGARASVAGSTTRRGASASFASDTIRELLVFEREIERARLVREIE